MVKRLIGLVMIVNTLLPVIIVLGLAAAGNLLVELFGERLKAPAQNMTSALAVLQEEADRARLTIIAVTAEVAQNISAAKMDGLNAHRSPTVLARIEEYGWQVERLPAYAWPFSRSSCEG